MARPFLNPKVRLTLKFGHRCQSSIAPSELLLGIKILQPGPGYIKNVLIIQIAVKSGYFSQFGKYC